MPFIFSLLAYDAITTVIKYRSVFNGVTFVFVFLQDLEAIDIKKVGFRQRLMREIKCLETLPVWKFDFPSNKKEVWFDANSI